MIALKDVSKIYQAERIETVALDKIQLEIEEGEMVSIMGPSGCGKSTLLNLIGLLDDPTEGSVAIDGRPVAGLGDKELADLRNRYVGFVFQSFHLIPDLSVADNVEIPLLYRKLSRKERRRRSVRALERVGLSSRVDHFPTQLSGGQQQRVAIARAVVAEPRIVLADEPTGNLDSHMGDEIMSILEGLNRDEKTTIVMVTHDEEKARQTQRIVRIFDGRMVH
ncbi:MAG: ABC transporter ATP-binding protein [Thermoanaerobaculia bacterium]|nr:ABC transporter ATP-binding protein [Thermoanaerobaculia bacterium]